MHVLHLGSVTGTSYTYKYSGTILAGCTVGPLFTRVQYLGKLCPFPSGWFVPVHTCCLIGPVARATVRYVVWN
jgi:hypothetical protein